MSLLRLEVNIIIIIPTVFYVYIKPKVYSLGVVLLFKAKQISI